MGVVWQGEWWLWRVAFGITPLPAQVVVDGQDARAQERPPQAHVLAYGRPRPPGTAHRSWGADT